MAILRLLDEHTATIDATERVAFVTLTSSLRLVLEPYAKNSNPANLGSERALIELLALLREWISIERNFCDSASFADAIENLRQLHKNEPETVLKICRAHSQLKETSNVVLLLIDMIGGAAISAKITPPTPPTQHRSTNNSNNNNNNNLPTRNRKKSVVDGAASLSAAVPCLSEIGNMSGNAIYDKLASRCGRFHNNTKHNRNRNRNATATQRNATHSNPPHLLSLSGLAIS